MVVSIPWRSSRLGPSRHGARVADADSVVLACGAEATMHPTSAPTIAPGSVCGAGAPVASPATADRRVRRLRQPEDLPLTMA